jgi:hypothetical protein
VAFDHEAQPRPVGTSHVDALAVTDVDDGNPSVIDEHPRRGSVVDRHPFAAIEPQQQMCAGDQRVCHAHVGTQVTPHDHIMTGGKTAP